MANQEDYAKQQLEELRAIRGLLTVLACAATIQIKDRREKAEVNGDGVVQAAAEGLIGEAMRLLGRYGDKSV